MTWTRFPLNPFQITGCPPMPLATSGALTHEQRHGQNLWPPEVRHPRDTGWDSLLQRTENSSCLGALVASVSICFWIVVIQDGFYVTKIWYLSKLIRQTYSSFYYYFHFLKLKTMDLGHIRMGPSHYAAKISSLTQGEFGDLWSYDLHTNVWTQLATTGNSPSPRDSMGFTATSSGLYLFGGCCGERERRRSVCVRWCLQMREMKRWRKTWGEGGWAREGRSGGGVGGGGGNLREALMICVSVCAVTGHMQTFVVLS